jgi:hypothetical protein
MFFAYPNEPKQIKDTIESCIKNFNTSKELIKSWKALDIVGSFIKDRIQSTIDEKHVLIAEISRLNFNVTYEIGYAIGRGKPILLTKNRSISQEGPSISEVGIFDTIGYVEYENSDDLDAILRDPPNNILYDRRTADKNYKTPIYLLETKFKTDDTTRITARIKKARLNYRSFDPNELPRLSAHDAIKQVAQSYGVVVPLLHKDILGFEVHNIRAAFIAGLTNGMDKPLCLLQNGDNPIPLDYRDLVNIYYHPNDIDNYIAEFAIRIIEAYQEGQDDDHVKKATLLQKLDLGASSAENEMRSLQYYYLQTDAFRKTARGEYQLVVGRKGSGKSAIFLQVRDRERTKGDNIVLDLKPEGYKLIKFKELVLEFLQEGTFQHTITAFWEYVLLLEICHKVLTSDAKRHMVQTDLYNPYRKLEELYKAEDYLTEGDFSERMSTLLDKLTISYKENYGSKENVRLSVPDITRLLYKTDLKKLRDAIISYLQLKEQIWLLFDNIDKGWPSSGLVKEDLIIIRTLVDASRKLQREFSKSKIELFPIIFLRNDVYDLLIESTSDRQKEAKVNLDWVDPDLLREVIRLRIVASLDGEKDSFDELWRSICISHYKGEETSQFLIDRCLMRPRFLINLINQCLGFAVNLNHKKIEEEDIEKGLGSFSVDVLTDISYEIRDVFKEAENIMYSFLTCKVDLSHEEIRGIIAESEISKDLIEKVIDILLWYGFLGLRLKNQDVKYIFNLNYNMQLLKGLIRKNIDNFTYSINPAFWPSLMIEN